MQLDGIIESETTDEVLREGVRRRLSLLTAGYARLSAEAEQEQYNRIVRSLEESPIAIETRRANEQHYELPPAFFEIVLGPHLKYSCCHFKDGDTNLEQAEADMLEMTAARARLQDGQTILDLGCGWGSLSLFMARRFPKSRVTAVSNSRLQKEFIRARAKDEGLENLRVETIDINDMNLGESFDRIVSVEMFEHVRNYRKLLARLRDHLKPGGMLFVHIFAHRTNPFLYDASDERDWMARNFFAGGTMPSRDLLYHFLDGLTPVEQHGVDGRQYSRTLDAWLERMDANIERVREIFRETYGEDKMEYWIRQWRMFFMTCSEFFGFRKGREWNVRHYLFRKPDVA